MTENKTGGLDFAAMLRGVSEPGTADQITLLPLDALHPDPENFYSLDGLDKLAESIELVGLMDPIRVRPDGESYVIVSGHRRTAAIRMIRDGGSDQFKDGVPCIVEFGGGSEAMRKLRLIFANSSTRQLTSAEQSRQAEEVTRLLYELKEQGVEFPGRMRDHVAEACNVSKTKIGRLHAIRENLHPALLPYYDSGELVEDVAWKLSRFPEEIQAALSDKLADGKKRKMPIGSVVEMVWNNLEGLQKPMSCRAHAGGPECHHVTERIVSSLCRPYSWNVCDPGKCCLDCWHAKEGCSGACREAKDRVKLEKAVEEEKKAEAQEKADRDQQILKKKIQKRALALLPYAIARKLDDKERISSDYRSATVGQLRKWASGDMEGEHFYGDECVRPGWSKDAAEMSRRLGCSLQLALDLPEEKPVPPAPEPEPEESAPAVVWRSGEPEDEGWYAVKIEYMEQILPSPRCFYWDGEIWTMDGTHHVDRAYQVRRWLLIPEEET